MLSKDGQNRCYTRIFHVRQGRNDSPRWSSWNPGQVESSALASAGIVCSKTQSRWGARAEPAAAVAWDVGRRTVMVVFPAAAESPGEREATYGLTEEEHGN